MLGFIQMPKVFVLRTVATVLAGLMTIEWALQAARWREAASAAGDTAESSGIWRSIRSVPGSWLYAGAAAVLLANLVSFVLSPVRNVSLWGIDPGWDSYGLFNVICYAVVFLAVALHLRHERQLRHLAWVLTGASLWVSFYAILQHWGVDVLHPSSTNAARSEATFGNPIFAAAWLLMTVPITLAWVMSMRERMSPSSHLLLGSGLIAPQVTAIVFSGSRGPWIGTVVATLALLALTAWAIGRAQAIRLLAILAVAFSVAVTFSALPAQAAAPPGGALVVRALSILGEAGGGLNNRMTIWSTAGTVFANRLWVDPSAFPEAPSLALRPLRQVTGYGQDMFGIVYPLAGESTYTFELATHGHSFIVHTAIELGLLGVAAYVGLWAAAVFAAFRIVRAAKAGAGSALMRYLAVALLAILVGRAVEQLSGKAQISDITLSWVLAGTLVGLMVMFLRLSTPLPSTVAPRGRQRPARGQPPAGKPAPAKLNPVRVAGASVICIALALVWWVGEASHALASVTAASGEAALKRGDLNGAAAGFRDAIDIDPDAPVLRLLPADTLIQQAKRTQDRGRKVERLNLSRAHARAVLDWNPLDHRGWSRLADASRELAGIDSSAADAAVSEARVLTYSLMPGFWQTSASLGWTYNTVDRPAEALAEFERALALTRESRSTEGVFFIHYLQALALEKLGRYEEALALARTSYDLKPTNEADAVIQRLLPLVPATS